MKATLQVSRFSKASLDFLQSAGKQDEADWLDENNLKYQQLIRLPLMTLAEYLKSELAAESGGYHFPTKGIGRIKRPLNKVGMDGGRFKDWVSYIATRPSESRFEKNPLLFFGLLPNDEQWKGAVIAGGLYMASSTQVRRIRRAIENDSSAFKTLFADKGFKKSFKSGFEPMVKASRCPRGFDPDHPDVEWIKLKTFFAAKKLSIQALSAKDLAENICTDFRQLLRLNALLQDAIDIER